MIGSPMRGCLVADAQILRYLPLVFGFLRGVAWKMSGLLRRGVAWWARDTSVVGAENTDRHLQQGLCLPAVVKGTGATLDAGELSSLLPRRYKNLGILVSSLLPTL